MRVALISDVHGNFVALEAVVDDIGKRGVDVIACLGDVATLGPAPAETIELVGEVADVAIRGNHEDYLFEPSLVRDYTGSEIVRDAVEWAAQQLESKHFELVRLREATASIELSKKHTALLFHGSPRDNSEFLFDVTPPDVLDEAFAGHEADVYCSGHTHLPLYRQHRDALLVNPGSVGAPFLEFPRGETPTVLAQADYAIIEAGGDGIDVQHIRLPLDRRRLRAAANVTGFPMRESLRATYSVL